MSAKNEITPAGNSRVELALIYFGCCEHVLHPSAEEATKHLRVLREALALCESPAAETQIGCSCSCHTEKWLCEECCEGVPARPTSGAAQETKN